MKTRDLLKEHLCDMETQAAGRWIGVEVTAATIPGGIMGCHNGRGKPVLL